MTRSWRPRPTLRTRLTVVYGALFLVTGTLLLALTYLLVEQSLRNSPSSGVASVVGGGTTQIGTTSPPPNSAVQSGQVVSLSPPNTEATSKLAELQDQIIDDALDTVLTRGALALGGVGIAAVALGWVIAGRTLRPLKHITATARRVAENNLHERIAIDGPYDELGELADTFDSMLQRLDDAFERLNHAFDGQRRFAANASHELRTPLTLNRTLLEVALDDPEVTPEVRRLATQLLHVNNRHERLIDGMLILARAENGIVRPAPVDLADTARYAVETVTADAQAYDVRLETDLRLAPTNGDPALLDRLVHNLVHNAVQYNTAGGTVEVSTTEQDGQAQLLVSNTGPTIPATEIAALFDPFHRHSERTTASNGTGLGLSIVNAVVQAHHGTVDAGPRDGGGLTIRVTLPSSLLSTVMRPAVAQ